MKWHSSDNLLHSPTTVLVMYLSMTSVHLHHYQQLILSKIRSSWRGCRWREPRHQQTAARSHTGGWWWRFPGRGCAPPWRWCGYSHRWRPRCSTLPTQHPPLLSWWERPLREPPAAGRRPHSLPIGPAARRAWDMDVTAQMVLNIRPVVAAETKCVV